MQKNYIKYNRKYYNTTFLSTLNNSVGLDFYAHLFAIYEASKQFISLRENQSSSAGTNLNTNKLNISVENYSTTLAEVVDNLSNQRFDDKLKNKLNFISSNFNEVIKQLEMLNNQLNPLAANADALKSLVEEVTASYKELQAIGTKRIFSAACKDDCRVNFLSRAGNAMADVFEKNWAIAQTESKNLITLANTAMQVVSRCPNGTETITDTSLKKLKNAIYTFEHM